LSRVVQNTFHDIDSKQNNVQRYWTSNGHFAQCFVYNLANEFYRSFISFIFLLPIKYKTVL